MSAVASPAHPAPVRPAPPNAPARPADRLTALAARCVGAPAALLALAGGDARPGDGGYIVVTGHGHLPAWDRDDATRVLWPPELTGDAPLTIADAWRDRDGAVGSAVRALGARACLAVPVVGTDGRTVGMLAVADAARRDWDAADVEALATVAEAVAAALELEREQAADGAARTERDALTGLPDRRGLWRMAAQLLKSAPRAGRRDAALWIRVDGLASVRDDYGPAEGDDAVRAIARIVARTIRDADVAGRVGADEFAVFAVGLRQAGEGEALAARLDAALAGHHGESAAAGRPYELACRVSVAELLPGDDVGRAFARAAAALAPDGPLATA